MNSKDVFTANDQDRHPRPTLFTFFFCPNSTLELEHILEKKSPQVFARWQTTKKLLVDEFDRRHRAAYPNFNIKISTHGEQGVRVLSTLLPTHLAEDLDPLELFLLMAGCYVHDIGFVSSHVPYTPIEHARHWEYGQMILENEEWLPFEANERKILGILCRWHNYAQWLENGGKKEESVTIGGSTIRVQLLVELMQLFDMYHHVIDVTWKNLPSSKNCRA